MFDIGGNEALLIILAILLLFGAKRIPDLAKSLGSGLREFRRAMSEISHEVTAATSLEPTPLARPPAPVFSPPESSLPRPPAGPVPPPGDAGFPPAEATAGKIVPPAAAPPGGGPAPPAAGPAG
ncbi:MAG TPA: twin-arginine translocase TatA/TatE family subunit [Candidatus Saccharimonadales bacterium]|nr:twin-arginine translocase TatA/TatE family subunit [Candidatus Saccharimonadales bacterium]